MVFGVAVRAVEYNENDAVRIHHLIRVHTFARIIGKSDGFDESNQKIAELALYCMILAFIMQRKNIILQKGSIRRLRAVRLQEK